MVLPARLGVRSQAGDAAPHYEMEEKIILTVISCFTSLPCSPEHFQAVGSDEPVLHAERDSTSLLQVLLLNKKLI